MKKTQQIKSKLNAHLDMLEKLEALKLELEYAEEQYGATKSPNYSGMPGGGGDKRASEPEVKAGRKIEIEEKVRRQQDAIDRDWAELEPLIEQLKPFDALIMNIRYREGAEWEDVCFVVFGKRRDYNDKIDSYMNSMFKAHGRALLELAEMLEKTT